MSQPKSNFNDLKAKFKELTQKSLDDQLEFFLKSFIFALDDKWKEVVELSKKYRNYLKASNESKDLNVIQASDFLQKHGLERTGLQRKEEIMDIDLDFDGRVCFIEYLLLHYKAMILQEYYKRTGETPKEDLSNGGIGVTGVGHKLLDELFTLPMGLDPELERAIEEFTAAKRARENRMKELAEKAAAGGVKGLAAKNELEQMEKADTTEMNRAEITLEAAKKRASKTSGEAALAEKKKREEEEEKRKREEGRAKLKGIAARWENN
eukprot:GEZU01042068.1.p1 GENE.GEZU01042068.1~~GEZU01042068.1.p1  ORF type:complete len:274 (+),score=185.28 GEZU01042068.1:26-823(+)